jgi:hypothetical protein
MKGRKFRAILMVVSAVLAIATLFRINYNDLSWEENSSKYLGIISNACVFIAMYFTNRSEKRKLKPE